MRKLNRYDTLVILLFLVIALIAALLIFTRPKKAGSYAVAAIDGVETARFPLDQNGEFELAEGHNILVIEGGSAYIKEADCPDQICVKKGKIQAQGQVITCLPHHLTVTIEGETGDADFRN